MEVWVEVVLREGKSVDEVCFLSISLLFLEAVDFDLLVADHALSHDKVADVLALVALELDDVAELGVVDDGAVAAELLLEGLQETGKVDLRRNALHGREGLLSVSLLDADVDVGSSLGSTILHGSSQFVPIIVKLVRTKACE
eukprot:CAMPEP_0184332200 /NCGR_PEP_ID=MMETSP1089-20130417/1427_1 /TAXON_ID=38269 ORGANISM="Gloeochaete wittrockiana, Strain SAG46.84" /NCGR_SAMPLE_ID=MMETSP1089 /ASSEMBLY_ACC=CAM_ASM_000445 /LENGTH=141 /DNA_ID=CAMNT_0026655473 /DNA_START=129 /DNA_END=554 /DNA_ORIENTATION=-